MKISLACGLMVTTNQSLQLSIKFGLENKNYKHIHAYSHICSQGSTVDAAVGYGWTTQGLNPGRGQRYFSSPNHPDWLYVLSSFLFNGYQDCFPGVRLPGHQVDHTPPSSAEVMAWSYTSTPSVCLHWMYQNILPFLHHV